jgi:mRNA (guanine-N7-)-methyltransferase
MENDFVKLSIDDLVHCIRDNDFKVNYEPHKQVKYEFEKFVNKEISERRKNSTFINMRKFHNDIKRTMYNVICDMYRRSHPKEQINCLEISCGRGGDMFKWNEAGIKNVFGFDKSRDSIESINPFNQGARERYSKSNVSTNIEYTVGNAVQPSAELMESIVHFMKTNKVLQFELLSCQFALHYFFQSEIALRNVFKAFVPLLKKGGYFMGTTVDGKNITGLLQKNTSFKSTLLEINKKYRAMAPRTPFGNAYTFKINDSVDQGNYFNTMGESMEYLVNLEVLKQIANEYNLKPVYLNIFEPIPGKRNQYTSSVDFINFKEIHELKKPNISEDELVINNLYTTFILIKN